MIAILQNWLSPTFMKLSLWAMMALLVLRVLMGAKQARRDAERITQLQQALKVKDAQMRATLDTPRSRDALVKRLRDGQF